MRTTETMNLISMLFAFVALGLSCFGLGMSYGRRRVDTELRAINHNMQAIYKVLQDEACWFPEGGDEQS